MKKSNWIVIILIGLVLLLSCFTGACFFLYKFLSYDLEELALIVSICDVFASIVTGSFIVVQLQADNESDVKRAKTEESKFILEYNMAFIENKELCDVEHYLEDAITHQGKGNIRSLTDARQSLINYLVFLEGFASCVQQETLELQDIDNLFSYRFFLAMNHPEVQKLELLPFADFYKGNYQLFDSWYQYRMKNFGKNYIDDRLSCTEVMPLAQHSLFNTVRYERYLKSPLIVTVKHDKEGKRKYTLMSGCGEIIGKGDSNGRIVIDAKGKIHDNDKIRGQLALKKNIEFYERFEGKQLSFESQISPKQFEQISKLIYETDPYIYPALFGEGGVDTAKILLPSLFETGEDAMFRKDNLFLLYDRSSGDVAGLILWISGSLTWNEEFFLKKAAESEIALSDEQVKLVKAQYVGARYSEETKDQISLINICVDSNQRGMGLGRLMLDEFICQHSESDMNLCVLLDNESAIALYKRCGFQEVRKSRGFSLSTEKPLCLDMHRKGLLFDEAYQEPLNG